MNKDIVDVASKPLSEKIFFGEFGHYLRIDNIQHDVAKKLKEQSEGNTWFAKEVPFDRDRIHFSNLPEDAQRAFKLNICYQTLMDSGVDNGYMTILKKIVTSSIWSMLYGRIGIEEQIHAESYSYGLIEMFGQKASETLDLVYTDDFIKTRMQNEIEVFNSVQKIVLDEGRSDDEAKKAVLKMLMGIYLLESVKFPYSFLVTFTINRAYNNAIQGMTRLIRLIAHDELNIHVPTNKNVLNILRRDEQEGFSHLFDWFDKEALAITETIVQQEIEWSKYLLDDRDVIGLNTDISEHFIKYRAMIALRDIGIKSPYNEQKSDIIDWFNDYRDISKQNAALQEATNISYQKSVLKNDLENFDKETSL